MRNKRELVQKELYRLPPRILRSFTSSSLSLSADIGFLDPQEMNLKLEEAKDELRLWRNGKMKERLPQASLTQPKDLKQKEHFPPPPLPPPPLPEEEDEDQPTHSQPNRSLPPAPSRSSDSVPQPTTPALPRKNCIFLDIDLGDGKKGIIEVTIDANPVVSSSSFILPSSSAIGIGLSVHLSTCFKSRLRLPSD